MDNEELGPTNEFPQGKLNDTDEGELKLAIGEEGGKVIIHFGTTVSWLALDKEKAYEFAELIKKRADSL